MSECDGIGELSVAPHDRENPVCSYTEWDELEEVVVGHVQGGVFPVWQDSMYATMPATSWEVFKGRGGSPFPPDQVAAAERELDGLVRVLEREGVKVMRPDLHDHSRPYSTSQWSSGGGVYSAMPRDVMIVVGDTIIEAPMSWRCRYLEVEPFRSLLKDYFQRGARWLAGPRPELPDSLFVGDGNAKGPPWAVTEFEPVFDAADFVRFGADIVAQRSHVTNEFGIEWVRRAIGDQFEVHVVELDDPHAMHIDATVVPLCPGKLLVNGQRYLPNKLFSDWETREAPPPTLPAGWPMYMCSAWVSMNVLSLDPGTVVVERQEAPLIAELKAWGFDCIPVDFRHVYTFGGSFHCVTLDVRRHGPFGRYL